jgi:hypothetical protein
MNKRFRFILPLLLFTIGFFGGIQAQDTAAPAKKYKIALFTPLYLDSAFTGTEFRYGNTFPKFLMPGLEFYEGAKLALDSLQKEGLPLEVRVYDTKSAKTSLYALLLGNELNDVNLMIGSANSAEVKMIAEASLKKNIPFISATFPNDAGVSNNPLMVIVNSTLKTHCESMYRYIQKNHSAAKVVVFRTKGTQEDRIKTYFQDFAKNIPGTPLKIRFVDLKDSFAVNSITPYLDTISKTICIAGSLDDEFGKRLTASLSPIQKKYPAILFGMPNWDNISRFFNKPEYKNIEVFYTTPYYNPRSDKASAAITAYFKTKFRSRPSDMVFRGYETMFRFAKLLVDSKGDISSSLGTKKYKVFNDFDIQPVMRTKDGNMILDYFENKKLYFIRKLAGEVVGIY